MYLLRIVLILCLMVDEGSTGFASEVCGKDMLTAFLHQNKVTGYCLNTVQNIIEDRNPIAFYAYMTKNFQSKGPSTTLIFDKTHTNVYNSYNNKTGVYTVPKSGIYVFNWMIREHKSQHSVELVRNSEVLGATFKRAEEFDDDVVSGTVVSEVREGDSVFLRTHPQEGSTQRIHNNLHGRSSFSGWRL